MTNEQILGAGISMGMLSVIAIILLIFFIIGFWKIFEKAGKPGWHAIIPFLNTYDIFDIGWKGIYGIIFMILTFLVGVGEGATGYNSITGTFQNPSTGWLAVITIAGIASIVLYIIGMYKLSKSFGHGAGFTIGLIFLSFIFILILAFGNNTYIGKAESTTQA